MPEMTEAEYQRQYYQIYHLPAQLERARRRVADLEAKARRYGMIELLRNPEFVNMAWDEAIQEAQEQARRNGDSIGFGDNGQ